MAGSSTVVTIERMTVSAMGGEIRSERLANPTIGGHRADSMGPSPSTRVPACADA